ncbi:MAG TPA: stage V sporulation protein S [Anaerolineales bacterium]|nr:stage V sporulation protein S [Anaerolineales bacterium]
MGELRIYSHTHPLQTAKTIAGMIHRHKHAEIKATSHPTVYQPVKTIAYAAALLKEQGIYVGFTATYIPKGTEGNPKEGFRFFIAPLFVEEF